MQYNSATINIIQGDITKVPTQAITTLINSGKMWFGGVDRAIMRVAGNSYHNVPASCILSDGDVIVAEDSHQRHQGGFSNVIFVVDDLKRPLGELVEKALDKAYSKGYRSVSFPAMRTGVMAGVYEQDATEAAMQMIEGLKRSIDSHMLKMTLPIIINIVVYNDALVKDVLIVQTESQFRQ